MEHQFESFSVCHFNLKVVMQKLPITCEWYVNVQHDLQRCKFPRNDMFASFNRGFSHDMDHFTAKTLCRPRSHIPNFPGSGRIPQSGPWQPSGACAAVGDRNGGAEAQGQARGARLRGSWQARYGQVGVGRRGIGWGSVGDGSRMFLVVSGMERDGREFVWSGMDREEEW